MVYLRPDHPLATSYSGQNTYNVQRPAPIHPSHTSPDSTDSPRAQLHPYDPRMPSAGHHYGTSSQTHKCTQY